MKIASETMRIASETMRIASKTNVLVIFEFVNFENKILFDLIWLPESHKWRVFPRDCSVQSSSSERETPSPWESRCRDRRERPSPRQTRQESRQIYTRAKSTHELASSQSTNAGRTSGFVNVTSSDTADVCCGLILLDRQHQIGVSSSDISFN